MSLRFASRYLPFALVVAGFVLCAIAVTRTAGWLWPGL